MSALRFAAAGVSFGICVLFGSVRKARLRRSLEELEALTEDIKYAVSCVKLMKLPVDEIVRRLAENGGCGCFWKSVWEGMTSGLDLKQAIAVAEKPSLSAVSGSVLSELADDATLSDSDTLAGRLSMIAERLDAELEYRRGKSREEEKLTSSLSVFAGLAAAILVL